MTTRWALVASVIAFTSPAWASDASAAADIAIARGVELRKAGKDLEAYAEFEHANAIFPSPRACAQIGLAELALGRWVDAEKHLTKALRENDDPWIVKQRSPLEMSLALVEPHLGWLGVETNVASASLYLDGVYVGILPMKEDARVVSGSVVVEVRAPGYTEARRRLEVAPATHMHERIVLVPVKSAPSAPPSPAPTPAPIEDRDLRPLGWSVLALGVVGLAAGSYFGIQTFASKSNRDAHCLPAGCDASGLGFDRDARRDATISTIAFGVGLVGVGAGLVFLLQHRGSPPPFAPGAARAGGVF